MLARKDFPILKTKIAGHQLVYFDNAATTQKPEVVITAEANFYRRSNANVHRGLDPLSSTATLAYEEARQVVADFIEAKQTEIIFTKGATESINLVARSLAGTVLKRGDIVVLSIAEHHANIIPWLQLKENLGIKIVYIPLLKTGTLDQKAALALLRLKNVKLLSLSLASNVLGIMNNLGPLLRAARQQGILTLVDAAQAISHQPVSVKKLSCDFLVFSAHKLYGPTGLGVLYGRLSLLESLPPFLGGGGMISEVSSLDFKPAKSPLKFEAGTPNIAGAIAFGAALKYLKKVTWAKIISQEKSLTDYFLKKLTLRPQLHLWGRGANKLPVFALTIKGVHPHDAADLLGQAAIVTRAGQHCAAPLHDYLGLGSTLRVSLCFYNTKEEIDYFFSKLDELYLAFNQA